MTENVIDSDGDSAHNGDNGRGAIDAASNRSPPAPSAVGAEDVGGARDGRAHDTGQLARERDEATDQAAALLEAAALLSRLAAMDPANVCQQRRRLGSRDGAAAVVTEVTVGEGETSAPRRLRRKLSITKGKKRWRSRDLKPGGRCSSEAWKGERSDDGTENQTNTEDLVADIAEVKAEKSGTECDASGPDNVGGILSGGESSDAGGGGIEHDDDDAETIQRRIDALHERWALEETPIPALLASVHRLQSNLAAVRAESDSATAEMRALHRSLAESRSREQKLERAVKKLYKQNKAMKDKLAKKRRDRKSLVKNMKEAVSGMKMLKRREEEIELEEREIASRLRVHETMMRVGSAGAKSKGVADNVSAAAASVDERDGATSSFSDFERTQEGENRNRTWSYDRDDHGLETGSVGQRSVSSCVLDMDNLSISESSASTASVDDSGVATVRLAPSATFPPPTSGDDSAASGDMRDIGDSILVQDVAGDDGLNWGSVRSKIRLGESISSGGGGSVLSKASIFSSTTSVGGQSTLAERGKDKDEEGERKNGGESGNVRDRAASADDVLKSWSSVRVPFGVGSSIRSSGGGGGDAALRGKLLTPTASSMGQRFMAQLRSPTSQLAAAMALKPSHVYKLSFPIGKKVGIQFQKIHLERDGSSSDDKTKMGDRDETVRFEHGKDADPSPLRTAAAEVSAGIKAIDSLLLGGGGVPGEAVFDDNDVLPDIGFLVCGYHGFNDELNVRPTLGARLVAIDGESLERGHWTFKRLRAVIEARSNSSPSPGMTSPSFFSMSFRNEPLTPPQQSILESAVAKADEQRQSFMSSSCLIDDCQSPPITVTEASSKSDAVAVVGEKSQSSPNSKQEQLDAVEELIILEEEKKEMSFLKKLNIKRKDSKDYTQINYTSATDNSATPRTSTAKAADTSGKDETRGNESPSVSASKIAESGEASALLSVPAKGESLSSTEDIKATMKAMSKKFKSLF